MTELEAAFFYGDYTALHELLRNILGEKVRDTTTQEEILS